MQRELKKKKKKRRKRISMLENMLNLEYNSPKNLLSLFFVLISCVRCSRAQELDCVFVLLES